jgi:hypothetical protein
MEKPEITQLGADKFSIDIAIDPSNSPVHLVYHQPHTLTPRGVGGLWRQMASVFFAFLRNSQENEEDRNFNRAPIVIKLGSVWKKSNRFRGDL